VTHCKRPSLLLDIREFYENSTLTLIFCYRGDRLLGIVEFVTSRTTDTVMELLHQEDCGVIELLEKIGLPQQALYYELRLYTHQAIPRVN